MNRIEFKILAASLGTKRVGVAVYERTELVFFAVKTLKLPRTNRRVRRQVSLIMQKLFGEFDPHLLVLKSPGKQQAKSKALGAALRQIKKEAEAGRIPVIEVSFDQVKAVLCGNRKPTKSNAFRILSETYPELERFVEYNNLSQAEYYNSLLSAAAIGFVYQIKTLETGQDSG